jgi:hypothetical protein
MSEKCRVPDCGRKADWAVIFYDVYLHDFSDVRIFHEPHESVPYICQHHLNQNELSADNQSDDVNVRKYRGHVSYRRTPSPGSGFVIYRPLDSE